MGRPLFRLRYRFNSGTLPLCVDTCNHLFCRKRWREAIGGDSASDRPRAADLHDSHHGPAFHARRGWLQDRWTHLLKHDFSRWTEDRKWIFTAQTSPRFSGKNAVRAGAAPWKQHAGLLPKFGHQSMPVDVWNDIFHVRNHQFVQRKAHLGQHGWFLLFSRKKHAASGSKINQICQIQIFPHFFASIHYTAHTVLHSTHSVTQHTQCYTAHTVLHSTHSVAQHTQCCTAHTVLHSTHSVTQHTQCCTTRRSHSFSHINRFIKAHFIELVNQNETFSLFPVE